ncbi:helix-turn-helix domain-containing protein [Marinomonas primoryensis]|uniref:AraC family transcriptional regulator n=1 Tax=Marinomonas primoryensis TaxID=178399 RepID=A0A859D0C9_9GAMM|nr:AraC family transcriptional regulator [Marinomonas primoryensis]QKK80230.1 AraC family transcriptional regulator [Marinomonas primoryensis]
MNKLQNIIDNFSIQSEVIFSGSFCGGKTLGSLETEKGGHLHYIRSGKLTVLSDSGHKMLFDQPAIILLPFATTHQVIADETDGAELICAAINFTALEQKQLVSSLPKLVYLNLDDGPMANTVDWMFSEIGVTGLGQKSIVGKMCDILLIQMLRKLSEEGLVIQGMLAGLSHPALAPTLVKLQEAPEEAWTLDLMAESAAMSRSKFSELFRDTVGQTPNDFLTDLRISTAQQLLIQDKPVSLVANKVGYEHGSVLARVFRKKTGLSPKEWLQKFHES